MKQHYEKPCARELGDPLPDAQGICRYGSIANAGFPTLTNNCLPGYVASGAGCAAGQHPSRSACAFGKVPAYYGCGTGNRAYPPCSVGSTVSFAFDF